VKEKTWLILDLRFSPTFRDCGPRFLSHRAAQLKRRSKKASAWMARPFRAGQPFTRVTCWLHSDATKYMLDPFTEVPTMVMVCDVIDPVTQAAL